MRAGGPGRHSLRLCRPFSVGNLFQSQSRYLADEKALHEGAGAGVRTQPDLRSMVSEITVASAFIMGMRILRDKFFEWTLHAEGGFSTWCMLTAAKGKREREGISSTCS